MAMKDRKTLKKYFKKGSVPNQASFENLIDSEVNKIDDGFSKSEEHGLMISSIGNTDRLLSFYDSIEDQDAQWVIDINKDGKLDKDKNDLYITEPGKKTPILTFSKAGKVGINEPEPKSEFEVNGWMVAKGRAGCYAKDSTFPADSKWHPITPYLNYCQAFEVVARTGVKNTGKHAVLHAVAVSAYGNSRSSIRKTRGHYNFWKPVTLQLRWNGSTHKYRLEMRCKQKLESNALVKYYITQLWSDEKMGIENQFRSVEDSAER